MANDPVISENLKECGGYSDKDVPVMVVSGTSLTPFFINAEKLCGDSDINTFLKKEGGNSAAIVEHAVKLYRANTTFRGVIDIITQKVHGLLPHPAGAQWAISGGQTRDWIFSGPVAYELGIPHVSLFKQKPGQTVGEDRVEILWPEGQIEVVPYHEDELYGFHAVHVADLLTKGSSVWSLAPDSQTRRYHGWIPQLNERGADVKDLVVVVDRLQGGSERLLEHGINTCSFVCIDEEFLRAHSKQPDVALAYVRDEVGWTQNYILENGVEVLVPYFKPGSGGKGIDRARRFMNNYGKFLVESEKMQELEDAVVKEHGKTIAECLGGK